MHTYAHGHALVHARTQAHTHNSNSHFYGIVNTAYCSHLEHGKLLSLVAGVLCIDELGEEELVELEALRKANIETERRRE